MNHCIMKFYLIIYLIIYLTIYLIYLSCKIETMLLEYKINLKKNPHTTFPRCYINTLAVEIFRDISIITVIRGKRLLC